MEDNIIIRGITIEDKEALSLLYDRVWPNNAGLHYDKTSWAIDTSEYPGVCAVDSGRIIGSRASFKANIYSGDKRITSVQFGDSCVDKEYRRMGLFTRMNKAFIDSFFSTGNELIYNVSVNASRKAYEKLGWVYLKSMSTIVRVFRPVRLLIKIKGRINKLAGNISVDSAPIPDVGVFQDSLFEERERQFCKDNKLHNRYDKDILQWRLGTNSGIRLLSVEDVGVCLYKTGEKNGIKCCVIGEMFLAKYSSRCFNKMLKALKALDTYDMMSISISHAHPLYPFFIRKGFFFNPLKPYINLGVRVNSDNMRRICLLPQKWAIASLDLDTF